MYCYNSININIRKVFQVNKVVTEFNFKEILNNKKDILNNVNNTTVVWGFENNTVAKLKCKYSG